MICQPVEENSYAVDWQINLLITLHLVMTHPPVYLVGFMLIHGRVISCCAEEYTWDPSVHLPDIICII